MSLNTVYVCQKFFSNLVFTISHSIPLILITFAMTILFIGVIAFFVQVVKTRAYLKKYLGKRLVISKNLKTTINNLDLSGKVDVVKDLNKFSFCYGIFKPRICLSTGLIKTITLEELKAVLVHESYHVKNYDPLKIILGQTASLMFFFIPILREIQQHFVLSKEIAADNMAIKYGDRESLVSVLNKLLVAPAPYLNGVAALANLDGLEKRILYLTGNQRKITFRPSRASILLSTMIAVFSLMVVNVPVYAVSLHEGSADHSLLICPSKEVVNYTKNLLYTPITDKP